MKITAKKIHAVFLIIGGLFLSPTFTSRKYITNGNPAAIATPNVVYGSKIVWTRLFPIHLTDKTEAPIATNHNTGLFSEKKSIEDNAFQIIARMIIKNKIFANKISLVENPSTPWLSPRTYFATGSIISVAVSKMSTIPSPNFPIGFSAETKVTANRDSTKQDNKNIGTLFLMFFLSLLCL